MYPFIQYRRCIYRYSKYLYNYDILIRPHYFPDTNRYTSTFSSETPPNISKYHTHLFYTRDIGDTGKIINFNDIEFKSADDFQTTDLCNIDVSQQIFSRCVLFLNDIQTFWCWAMLLEAPFSTIVLELRRPARTLTSWTLIPFQLVNI